MSSVPARGFFGVQVQDAGNDLGARVVAVIPDTAAALSGVRMNDIITRVGLFKVRDTATTIAAIGIHSAGAKVSFTILREQETVTVTATLGKRPEGMDP
jgi:S1-C subfamily serine protease